MKYRVYVAEVHYNEVLVEAASEDEAKDKAIEALSNANELEVNYSHDLPKDQWQVEEVEEVKVF